MLMQRKKYKVFMNMIWYFITCHFLKIINEITFSPCTRGNAGQGKGIGKSIFIWELKCCRFRKIVCHIFSYYLLPMLRLLFALGSPNRYVLYTLGTSSVHFVCRKRLLNWSGPSVVTGKVKPEALCHNTWHS